MPARSLLPLVALCALGGCFTPDYHCRILCGEPNDQCPSDFECVVAGSQKLCAKKSIGNTCPGAIPIDASSDATTSLLPDASTPDSLSVEAGPVDAAASMDAGDPPTQLCHGTNCFDLSPETRKALVLWLDPSNLPPAGMTVSRWPDRSGRRNDGLALSTEALPRSSGNGLRFQQGPGGAMRLLKDASLDFGTSDFALLIVASVAPTPPSCFYADHDGNRTDPRGVALRWAFSDSLAQTTFQALINRTKLDSDRRGLGDQRPHLFVLRRTGASAELRLDGSPAGLAPLESAAVDASTGSNVYLGGCGDAAWPVPAMHAAIAVKGEVPLPDLNRLEQFLIQSFAAPP
jgi:hypothetical protein